jgi:hypothetical protein
VTDPTPLRPYELGHAGTDMRRLSNGRPAPAETAKLAIDFPGVTMIASR